MQNALPNQELQCDAIFTIKTNRRSFFNIGTTLNETTLIAMSIVCVVKECSVGVPIQNTYPIYEDGYPKWIIFVILNVNAMVFNMRRPSVLQFTYRASFVIDEELFISYLTCNQISNNLLRVVYGGLTVGSPFFPCIYFYFW